MTFLPLLLAVSLATGNAEFEKASVATAADIACARTKAALLAAGPDAAALKAAMLADPAAFRTRDAAARKCRDLAKTALAASYRTAAAEIVRSLDANRAVAPLDDAALDASLAATFDRAFDRARADACAEQASRIALTVKPDEAEIESGDDATVRAALTERIARTKTFAVFDENRKYISEKIVDPLLADARRERKRQQEYLMRTRCDALAPSKLAAELEANLRKNVAERRAKCDDPERAWNVFPQTLRKTLPTAVEHRLAARAVRGVEEAPLAVDAQAVHRILAAHPAAHRKAKASERLFRARFACDLAAAAIVATVRTAPTPERAELAAYLQAHTNETSFVRAVDARIRRDVLPVWKSARQAFAADAARRLWPTLADDTWYPDADLADRTAARSDYDTALRNWRRLPEMRPLAGTDAEAQRRLEESDASADQSVVRAFGRARKAIVAQHAIVGEVHPTVLADARARKNSFFRRTPDLAAVTESLTAAVETSWRAKRPAVLWGSGKRPANADAQHAALFPSVRREIALVARQILDEMKRPESTAKADAPSAGKKPEETPPEQEICTISFERRGNAVTVRAKRGKNVIAERTSKASASGFENAVREVGAVVGREILKLK